MELMERMAYYGVRLVVPVYLVLSTSDGGPGLTHSEKGMILAGWAATQSWLPTFSGGLSDRYGYKRTLAAAVVLKATGYLIMAEAQGFWPMVLGTQVLAAGTGIFKPGIQGTMAHGIARSGNMSMGWGLFYQSVNFGAFLGAYVPAYTRHFYGWPATFYGCSALVAANAIPLFFYDDPVDERQTTTDHRSLFTLIKESVQELFTSPLLLGFVFVSAGFWFTFHQFFDMLPNYVDDWTNSSGLRTSVGTTLGWSDWVSRGQAGENIPQEQLLNLNSFLIMTTMFVVAWLSSRVHVLTSTAIGWAMATGVLAVLVYSPSVTTLLFAIVVFTVGEMMSSPKKQEFMAMLAPPGKRALYLGYANMPDGIGWVLGGLAAGNAYETKGDKVNLTRQFLKQHADGTDVSAWLSTADALGDDAKQEVVKHLGVANFDAAKSALSSADVVSRWADALPRGDVIEVAIASVPTLPNGAVNSADALRQYLFATYNPGQVWWIFVGVGLVSALMMVAYSVWARKTLDARPAAE